MIAGIKENKAATGDPGKLSDGQLRELILAGIVRCHLEDHERISGNIHANLHIQLVLLPPRGASFIDTPNALIPPGSSHAC